ncbi:histidine-containing phosphotransfer protein 2-like isoform X1 [Triticum urartu]|uniref:histidine-containing phosphotransfer protein 2-like isoform X1 n=1 Tax=Triticum urartu TaxID=4572 RepID=UPI0020438577|nr:histidine-containing phosphotransfer protein 2-like isoform X1 [Triticum urartu]
MSSEPLWTATKKLHEAEITHHAAKEVLVAGKEGTAEHFEAAKADHELIHSSTSSTMAAAALRERLNNLVTSMFATGMLDENFHQLQSMEEDGTAARGYAADMINLFIKDTKRILNDIAGLLSQPVVDYDMVDVLVRQLKGSSYSVGAKKVNLSCMQFRRFNEPRSKERCLMALALAWSEFCDVRSKFEAMMQIYCLISELEEQIATYGPK